MYMYTPVLKFNLKRCVHVHVYVYMGLEIQFWKCTYVYLRLFDQSGNVPCMCIVNIFSVETQVAPTAACVHLSWRQSDLYFLHCNTSIFNTRIEFMYITHTWKKGVCRANQANDGQLFQAGWPSSAPCTCDLAD